MEILNQFGINPLLLAAQVVNFFILLFILKKLLYGPILKVLEARRKKIEESLENAQDIEMRLQKTIEDEQKMLSKAAAEGEKIIKGAEEMKFQIIEEGKIKAGQLTQKMIEETKDQLQMEREKLRQEVMNEMGTIVSISLEKIIGKVSDKKQKELIDKTIREFRA